MFSGGIKWQHWLEKWLVAAFTIRVLMTILKDILPEKGFFFKTGSLPSNNLQIRYVTRKRSFLQNRLIAF